MLCDAINLMRFFFSSFYPTLSNPTSTSSLPSTFYSTAISSIEGVLRSPRAYSRWRFTVFFFFYFGVTLYRRMNALRHHSDIRRRQQPIVDLVHIIRMRSVMPRARGAAATTTISAYHEYCWPRSFPF